jgi:hypothetical protein
MGGAEDIGVLERGTMVDLTTGAVVSSTDEDFPEWQHNALRLAGEILETDHYLLFRSMMTTYGMIYVTPYAIEIV